MVNPEEAIDVSGSCGPGSGFAALVAFGAWAGFAAASPQLRSTRPTSPARRLDRGPPRPDYAP